MEKLEIISVNVRGLNTPEKRKKIYSWLKESNTDIVLLQETHYIEKNENLYNYNWKGDSFHAFSDSAFSKGVSVLFNDKIKTNIMNVRKSIDGRRILINIEIDSKIFTLVNIYAPNDANKRCEFFKKLKVFISKNCINENIILCGDFNCNMSNNAD